MKRKLTADQIQKRDERRAKFKALWKQVAAMPQEQRTKLVTDHAAVVTCEGRALSCVNSCLLIHQFPGVSVVGGFRQWLEQGRCVRKGERGLSIWIPMGTKKSDAEPSNAEASEGAEVSRSFIVGTVFDITQTAELETNRADILTLATATPELIAA